MKRSLGLVVLMTACGGNDPGASDASVDSSTTQDATMSVDSGSGSDASIETSTVDSGGDAGGMVLRFVAMGDTGKANTGQNNVAAAIAKKCMTDGCDFVQLLGDNIYDSGVTSTMDAQWQTKFEMPYAAINLDFYAVLGNHDYGGGGLGNEFGKGQFEIDYTNVSKKWKMPANRWHRTLGNAEFFALDTNLMIWFQTGPQKNDIDGWVKASSAQWKFAFGHHPYLSNGPHGNAGSYDGVPLNGSEVKSFMDDVICGKVDFYVCGHDHDRQWLKSTCKGTELIVSGAGASTTGFKGNQAVWFQDDTKPGFVYFKIEGKKLTVEFIDEMGNLEFTRTLMK